MEDVSSLPKVQSFECLSEAYLQESSERIIDEMMELLGDLSKSYVITLLRHYKLV